MAHRDTISPGRNGEARRQLTFHARPRMKADTWLPLCLSESYDIPLQAFGLIAADEGRLTTHGQAYIVLLQSASILRATC